MKLERSFIPEAEKSLENSNEKLPIFNTEIADNKDVNNKVDLKAEREIIEKEDNLELAKVRGSLELERSSQNQVFDNLHDSESSMNDDVVENTETIQSNNNHSLFHKLTSGKIMSKIALGLGFASLVSGAKVEVSPGKENDNLKNEKINTPQTVKSEFTANEEAVSWNEAKDISVSKKYNNIVEKQKYWDSLIDKYGEGVRGRQNYIDLYDAPLPEIKTEDKLFYGDVGYNLTDYLPEQLRKKVAKYNAYNDSLFGDKSDKYARENYLNKDKIDIDSLNPNARYNLISKYRDKLDQAQSQLLDEIVSDPTNTFKTNQEATTWRKVFSKRKDIPDKALLFASLMDEGGDKFSAIALNGQQDMLLAGYGYFGLDNIANDLDNFVKKGYLDKNFGTRIRVANTWNEKDQPVNSINFASLDDVIEAKNAYMMDANNTVIEELKKYNITPSKDMLDYFSISVYNYGKTGTKKMINDYASKNLLNNNQFMTQPNKKYGEVHRNISRRLQARNMLVGEGVFKDDNK